MGVGCGFVGQLFPFWKQVEILGKGTVSFLETVENAGSVQITPFILIYICIKVSYARK